MTEAGLKLTTYFGERDRIGDGFAADALTGVYARHRLAVSLLLRGVEGFGLRQHVRTDRLLTLSEDLPLVSVAVDTRPRVEAALEELGTLPFTGLVTLERARLVRDAPAAIEPHATTKLTVYAGRHERAGGRPVHEAVVALLHRHGVAGATVLLGVDGTVHGRRERARFFGRNAHVPVMIVAVGTGATIASALPELEALLQRPLLTVERVRVCKRDGAKLAEPEAVPGATRPGSACGRS